MRATSGFDQADPDTVRVGRIGRPHGLRGDVTVVPTTDDPQLRFAVGAVLDTEPGDRGPLTVAMSRSVGTVLVVNFAGCEDRDAAETLRGLDLLVPIAALPPLGDGDEFYDHQLVGLRVEDAAGVLLGEVAEVLHPPAAPVLRVSRAAGGEEYVPFVTALVPTVDLAAGRLVVDPPDGMFE